MRGREDPDRSPLWNNVSHPSEVLKKLSVERDVGGMSQRDMEEGGEEAGGHLLLSKRTVSDIAESLAAEYEGLRTRDLRQEPGASLCIETGYAPLRRGGQKPGVLWVWAICEEGRKGLLSRSTAKSERLESCREVVREVVRRGLRPPATITTEGAVGLTQALAAVWPKSLRMRCWFPKRQNLQPKSARPSLAGGERLARG
jgi:transposase-like protein